MKKSVKNFAQKERIVQGGGEEQKSRGSEARAVIGYLILVIGKTSLPWREGLEGGG